MENFIPYNIRNFSRIDHRRERDKLDAPGISIWKGKIYHRRYRRKWRDSSRFLRNPSSHGLISEFDWNFYKMTQWFWVKAVKWNSFKFMIPILLPYKF